MEIQINTLSDATQRWLFVCIGGIDRSPIAAAAARSMAAERGKKIESDHLGLGDAMTANFLKQDYFDKFDLIFVMEEYLATELREKWGCRGDIVCLDVQDAIACNTLEDAQALDRIMRAKLEKWI